MRIYLANKNDETKAAWLEIPCEIDDVTDCLERIGTNDEYIISTDDDFCGYCVQENDNIFLLNELSKMIADLENDPVLIKAVFKYLECMDLRMAIDTLDNIYDRYILHDNIKSEEEFGQYIVEEHYFDEIGRIDFLANYIDYEAIGRDMVYSGEIYFTDYGCLQIIP